MQNYFWVQSEKNRNNLVVEMFYFRVKGVGRGDKCYWKCSFEGCSVTATTSNAILLNVKGEYIHANDTEKILQCQFKEFLKHRISLSPYTSGLQLYSEGKDDLDRFYGENVDNSEFLPSFDT
ncbi:hypothetical protein DMUE_0202 [Dictyocoela muelleri]|nr:hypothetical protein DMUE_0202 [Dictyocoela muelleri]